jgi:ferredoxin
MIAVNVSAPCVDEELCTGCGAGTEVCRVFSKAYDEVPVS